LIASALRRAFEDNNLNAVITPSLPATAAKKDQDEFTFDTLSEHISVSYVRTTAPFNVSGQPAISVPCGFDSMGLPIGLQIATRPFDETGALRIAHAYATSTDWQLVTPKIG
jgi:aspartyl-tRNA(Asn)/glutamyl-tRNA(Gln) amidotransferase subunit A